MVQSSNTDFDQNSQTETSEITSLNTQKSGSFVLPTNFSVSDAELTQQGQDLILKFSDTKSFSVDGYFSQNEFPLIQDTNGGSLNKALVDSFLTSSPEYAQNGSINDVSPVGAVEEMQGSAKVIRAHGGSEELTLGSPIYEGDVIETSSEGALNIMFMDETSLAISEGARVAVDEYSYDETTESGVTDLSVLKGVFVYTSGLIGRDDPDDVKIDTPVGSIGIRGTVIAGKINPNGESEISVLEGAIVVKNGTGEQTLSQQYETVKLLGFKKTIEYKGVEAAESIGKTYGSVSDVLPNLFSSINDNIQQEIDVKKTSEELIDNEAEENLIDVDANPEEISTESAESDLEDIANLDSEISNTMTLETGIETTEDINKNVLTDRDTALENKILPHNLSEKINKFKENYIDQALNNTPNNGGGNNPPQPHFKTNLKPLFEKTEMGSIVGTIEMIGYPIGTTISFDGGATSVAEFDIIQNGNIAQIKLNTNLGDLGTPLTAGTLNIIATLPNSTVIPVTTETPILEDAKVNLNSDGGYDHTVNGATKTNIQLKKITLDVNGDGTYEHIDTNASGEIRINGHNLLDNPSDGFHQYDNIGDINNDGYDDLVVGVSGYDGQSGEMDTGRIGILTGDFGDFGTGYDNPYRDTGAWFRNPELHIEDHFGSSVAGIGDFDGDGKEDILVGSINNHDGSGNRPGAAFILTDYEFDGSQDNNSITSSSHLEGIGGNDFDYSKYIDGIGDFNGDGLSDIMIGYNGGVQVIYGGDALGQDLNYNTLGFDRAFNITDTDFITGASAGDINGDGFDDFAVSHDDGTDINTYVVYGRDGINANLDLDNLENPDNALKINHAGVSGQNYQITELGDVNGDGFGDIQLGIKGGQQFTVHGQYSQSHSDVVTDNGTYNDGTTKDGNLNENEITATINGQSLVGDADYFYDSDKTGIRMTGGRGNNTFQIDNDDFARIQGGKGFDTISLTQGSVMLDFSNFNYEQIQGIEEIEFGATNQTITLTAENIFNILKTSDNGELRISGEGTFKIDADTATDVTGALNELGEGATYIGPTDLDSDAVNDHYHYKIGGYDLYVDQDSAINII